MLKVCRVLDAAGLPESVSMICPGCSTIISFMDGFQPDMCAACDEHLPDLELLLDFEEGNLMRGAFTVSEEKFAQETANAYQAEVERARAANAYNDYADEEFRKFSSRDMH